MPCPTYASECAHLGQLTGALGAHGRRRRRSRGEERPSDPAERVLLGAEVRLVQNHAANRVGIDKLLVEGAGSTRERERERELRGLWFMRGERGER